MKIILGHAKSFLKQTENRSITFDKFSMCLDSTVARIENTGGGKIIGPPLVNTKK